jgi:hypothetical protein
MLSAQWMTACILAGSPVDEKDFEVRCTNGVNTTIPSQREWWCS